MLKNKKCQAFSLIEVSLVLLIVGVLASGAITGIRTLSRYKKHQQTKQNIENVKGSLVAYLGQNMRLPCPSLNGDGVSPDVCNTQNSVGWVPYKTLKITEDKVKNSNGNWLIYAVEPELTKKFKLFNEKLKENDDLLLFPDSEDENSAFCTATPINDGLIIKDVEDKIIVQKSDNDCIAFIITSQKERQNNTFQEDEPPAKNINFNRGNSPNIEWISRNNLMSNYLKKPCIKLEK